MKRIILAVLSRKEQYLQGFYKNKQSSESGIISTKFLNEAKSYSSINEAINDGHKFQDIDKLNYYTPWIIESFV